MRYRSFELPEGMGCNEAAAMPIVYHTSWFALNKRGNLQGGEILLVHAGASGVGMSAIQIGKAMGARVIATAGDAGEIGVRARARRRSRHRLQHSRTGWTA